MTRQTKIDSFLRRLIITLLALTAVVVFWIFVAPAIFTTINGPEEQGYFQVRP